MRVSGRLRSEMPSLCLRWCRFSRTLSGMAFGRREKKSYDEASLYEYAVGALGRKMRTVAELKRLMRTRVGHQSDGDTLIESVISRLKEQRYLNDSQYAASYSALRKDNEKFGRMRVVQDLKAKGVHGDVIDKAVSATYSGVNEEQLARAFLFRKRAKKPADQKSAARIFRMLARAGFSTRAIVSILRKWEVEDETLTLLEQETVDSPERGGEEDV